MKKLKLKKFVVELTAVRDLDTRVEVLAETEEGAGDIAREMSSEGNIPRWNEQGGVSEVEVNSTEERGLTPQERPHEEETCPNCGRDGLDFGDLTPVIEDGEESRPWKCGHCGTTGVQRRYLAFDYHDHVKVPEE